MPERPTLLPNRDRPGQVDPGGLDRGMPGLGLHRLQAHPGLAQLSQAGVPQLVTGRVLDPRPAAGTVEDLIQPVLPRCAWMVRFGASLCCTVIRPASIGSSGPALSVAADPAPVAGAAGGPGFTSGERR